MSENAVARKKQIPLQEGLFAQDSDGRYHLLATQCDRCKLTFFPKRKYCAKCGSSEVHEVQLSDRGKVFTFSLIDRKSKYTLIEPPYIQAEVQMSEGIRVFTVLDQCGPEDVSIGMPVEVYVDKVQEDPDGNDVITFKFRPVV